MSAHTGYPQPVALDNRVQFAVVREDPEVERAVLDGLQRPGRAGPPRALLVASGGCTALTLAAARPDVKLTLLDANAAQLALIERKVAALVRHAPASPERARLFGVGAPGAIRGDDPDALTACGNFESLFRSLQAFLDDLVLPRGERAALLTTSAVTSPLERARLLENKYWPAAFEMFFSDALLEAMFGKDATQHAPRGSYPGYFRGVLERGLARADAATNFFLHHALLGAYVDGSLPSYLAAPCQARFDLVHSDMAQAPSFADFDLISLSNLFDWMDASGVEVIARRLCAECTPGTAVIVRQLNNDAPIATLFEGAFRLDERASRALHARDRSLFYQRLLVLVRNP